MSDYFALAVAFAKANRAPTQPSATPAALPEWLSPEECQAEASALECTYDGPMPDAIRERWMACRRGKAKRAKP